jgi:hypothetical protein
MLTSFYFVDFLVNLIFMLAFTWAQTENLSKMMELGEHARRAAI